MTWFPLYDEALHDPKIQKLEPSLFKHWFNLICLANQGDPRGILPSIEHIAFALRISDGEAKSVIEDLLDAGLLSLCGGNYTASHWHDEQQKKHDPDLRKSIYEERRRANNAHLPGLPSWDSMRTAVFVRDYYRCVYCGCDVSAESGIGIHCDHILPVSKGGTDEMSNLATACAPCNFSKGSKRLAEWKGGAR